MQGDIQQLEQLARQSQTSRRANHGPQKPSGRLASEQIAIYNEDDLSHLLYTDAGHDYLHAGSFEALSPLDILHSQGYGALPTHASGTFSPLSEANESAILSDCEFEEDDTEIPPSPTRPRGGSICSETAEQPAFLNRRTSSSSSSSEGHPSSVESRPTTEPGLLAEGNTYSTKHVQFVRPEHHVSAIEGSLMSWWPAPLDDMEHDWSESLAKDESKLVQEHHHVAEIEGPMMSFWPAPLSMMEYEWSDEFYE